MEVIRVIIDKTPGNIKDIKYIDCTGKNIQELHDKMHDYFFGYMQRRSTSSTDNAISELTYLAKGIIDVDGKRYEIVADYIINDFNGSVSSANFKILNKTPMDGRKMSTIKVETKEDKMIVDVPTIGFDTKTLEVGKIDNSKTKERCITVKAKPLAEQSGIETTAKELNEKVQVTEKYDLEKLSAKKMDGFVRITIGIDDAYAPTEIKVEGL